MVQQELIHNRVITLEVGTEVKKPVARTATLRPRTHPEINEFRRRALIEGTIRSLAEHGVGGTTVRTICEAAGSSRGLIGHYYNSKEDLLAAAFQHLFNTISEQVHEAVSRSGPSAVARLKTVPSALLTPPVFTELNRHAFLSFWHEVRFNTSVRKANRQLYRDYIDRVETLFEDAAQEAHVQIDYRRAALALIGLMDGLWLGLSIHDKVISQKQAIDICHQYINQQLTPPQSPASS
ncbi:MULTISPECIES: TetR family transcriptional regulator C-terminal domain-containing protein [Limibacillus]|uniref:AcrR family transcriptional regulator n=1 Tax=Limibacillus halophilus TaxID=1579333 RepID=A0A839SQZ7_9PROT|nr:TetR family transcriptional regulator C-terminal domain-containing protein [Limibacillus halophilus]MBB3064160.1 AcrR family transcriptional regulator [Limibacillus halophilus]